LERTGGLAACRQTIRAQQRARKTAAADSQTGTRVGTPTGYLLPHFPPEAVKAAPEAEKKWETTLDEKLAIRPVEGVPADVLREGAKRLKLKAEETGFEMKAGQKVKITQKQGEEDITEFYLCLWDPISGKEICIIFTRPW
jgi:hypothetical protein